MQKQRPSWDEYFTKIVQATRERSPCHRLQVGCLLVKDNRIVSQGYNGFLPGCEHIHPLFVIIMNKQLCTQNRTR